MADLISIGFKVESSQVKQAIKTLGELGFTAKEAAKDIEASADKQAKAYAKTKEAVKTEFKAINDALQRQIDGYHQMSKASQVEYDAMRGHLKQYTAAQQQALFQQAKALDNATAAAKRAAAEQAEAARGVAAAQKEAAAKAEQRGSAEREFAAIMEMMQRQADGYSRMSRSSQIHYDAMRGHLKQYTAAQQEAMYKQAKAIEDAEEAKMQAAQQVIRNQSYDTTMEMMQRQIDGYHRMSKVSQVEYDAMKGHLAGYTAEQIQALKVQAAAYDAAGGSMRSLRGMSQNLGWQMQDIAIQMQMGTNAAVIFTQQGSQLVSAFNPLAGAFIAVGGALVGALLPSLFSANDAAKDLVEETEALISKLDELSAKQQAALFKHGIAPAIEKTKSDISATKSLIKEAEADIERLKAEHGQYKRDFSKAGGGRRSANSGIIDNTEKIKEKTEELNKANRDLIESQEKLQFLNDPRGSAQKTKDLEAQVELTKAQGREYWEIKAAQEGIRDAERERYILANMTLEALKQSDKPIAKAKEKPVKDPLESLKQEVELLGLKGEAYHIVRGKQEELTGATLKDYVALNKRIDAYKAEEEALEASAKAAKEAEEKEDARKQAVNDLVNAMQREIDLFDKKTRYQQALYDIQNGYIEVVGGVEGAEAKRILTLAKLNDELVANAELTQMVDGLIASVDGFGGAWTRTGDTVADALGSIVEQFDNYQARLRDVSKLEKDHAKALAEAKRLNNPEEEKRLAAAEIRIAQERTKATIAGYRQMASASSQMFKEGSKERKAMHNLEKTLSAVELAMALKQTAASVAAGAAKFFAQSGWWGFAGVAAMAGVMGSLGYSMNSGGGGQKPQENQAQSASGTMLGSDEKSNAIIDSLDAYQSIGIEQLSELRNIRDALRGMVGGIGRVSRGLLISDRFNAAKSGLGTTSNFDLDKKDSGFGSVGNILKSADIFGIAQKPLTALFGKTTKKLKDSGLNFAGQSLGDILANGIEATYFSTIETTKKKLFGLSKKKSVADSFVAADADVSKDISSVFRFIGQAVGSSVDALGITAEKDLNDFAVTLGRISLHGLSGEEQQKQLEAVFSKQADLMAQFVMPSISQFQQIGEGAFETITRLAQEQAVFNDAIDKLGVSLQSVSAIVRIDIAQSIYELVGGVGEFKTLISEYVDAFYTDAEKLEFTQRNLSEAFASIGVAMPTTTEGFRALVEGLDLTSATGQKTFAALMELSPAFSEYVKSIKKVDDAVSQLASKRQNLEIQLLELQGKSDEALARKRAIELAGTDEALKALQLQIYAQQDLNKKKEAEALIADKQKKGIEDTLKAAKDAAEEQKRLAQGVYNSISGALKALMGESEVHKQMSYAQAKMTLTGALATAKQGKSLVGYAGLEDALSAIQGDSADRYSSSEAFRIAQAQNIGLLSQLAKFTKVDGSHATGLDSVPFDGYVAELHQGERVLTKAQTAQQDALTAEVQALRREIRAAAEQQIVVAQKTNKVLNKWDYDGMPLERTV